MGSIGGFCVMVNRRCTRATARPASRCFPQPRREMRSFDEAIMNFPPPSSFRNSISRIGWEIAAGLSLSADFSIQAARFKLEAALSRTLRQLPLCHSHGAYMDVRNSYVVSRLHSGNFVGHPWAGFQSFKIGPTM